MKHIVWIFILLLLGSCTTDNLYTTDTEQTESVTVQFTVDVPEAQPLPTRAINENLITNLYLVVFDENARFISRHLATLIGTNFTVTLPQSSNKRIVHFVANYDWTGFNDAAAVTKDEGEIIAPLQNATDLLFWQRLVLTGGINANVFTLQPVSLIRNMAKFTLQNKPLSGLANAQFALFNTPSKGSAAPFNTVTRTFEPVITEPVGATYTGTTPFGTTAIYTFERKNSTVTTTPTYVIVQGTYAGTTSYYKIDIIDAAKNMYDIQRNVWFNIVIESVTMVGYATVDAAKNSPASNNISASVLLQYYPTISDGAYVLSVDKTVVSFTSNGQTLNATATYKTVAGVAQNASIVVTLVQDPAFPVVNGTVTYNPVTGSLTAPINNIPTGGVARVATIKIEAGNLSRTIRLLLHAPFTFTAISLTPSTVSNVLESPTTLKFTIPAEAEYLLPFNCYITSAYLTPVFGNIEVIHENGVYKYKWKVTAVGEQTINLKTNTDNASETVLIGADLFQQGQIAYTNTNNVYRFSNVVLTPNPVDFGAGEAVALKFTVPTAGVYKIYTDNLTLVGSILIGGAYNYTATTAGEQTINFVTNKINIAEKIRLNGPGYIDYTIPLKNQLVKVSGTLNILLSTINNGTVTVSVGTNVVGTIITSATGTYQTSLQVNIGDLLIFRYTNGAKTYTATALVTAAVMNVSLVLL